MADLEERFEIFSAFRLGMIEFFSNDLADDGMKHRKGGISHRIALRLRPYFPMLYTIDIDTDGADVLVWKEDEIPLAIFWSDGYLTEKEKKILTTFSIEPSFKAELEELFTDMGLGWAAGVRFALREFYKKYSEEN